MTRRYDTLRFITAGCTCTRRYAIDECLRISQNDSDANVGTANSALRPCNPGRARFAAAALTAVNP